MSVTQSVRVTSWDVSRFEAGAWALVVLAALADVMTTVCGLHIGLTESNPIAADAIATYGVAGMVSLKLFGILLALFWYRFLDEEYRAIAPVALALPWAIAAVVNLYIISSV